MAVKIIKGNQIFFNGSFSESETKGKIKIHYDDAFFAITTDGDDFVTSYINMSAGGVSIVGNSGDNSFTINGFGCNIVGIKVNMSQIPTFADNAAAVAGGLVAGGLYMTSGAGAAPLNIIGLIVRTQ